MKRAILAALAVLGISLVTSLFVANAYTSLAPSYTYEGNNN